jgi:hypothetical protein
MATNFPTSLDNLTNPAGSDPVNNPSHASQHANLNDAIEKLEEKVGVNNSAVTTSLDYRVKQLETNPVAGYTDEEARNAIGAALTGSGGITVTPNNVANTITVSTDSTIATKTYVDTAVSNLGSTAASTYVPVSEVGQADGIATLDVNAQIPLSQLGNLVDGAPTALNTLNELAAAINDDASYAAGITTALGNKLDSNYVTIGNTLLDGISGQTYGLIGTSAYLDVKNTNGYNKEIELDIASVESKLVIDGFAKLASPALTGTPTAPTAAVGTDSTQVATTAFVIDQIDASTQPGALYQTTAPTSPEIGQIWIDSDEDVSTFDSNIIRRKAITATAGQTVFTADLPFIDGFEQIFMNGLLLVKTTDYATSNSNTVTLTSAAAASDIIEIVSVTGANSVDTYTQAEVNALLAANTSVAPFSISANTTLVAKKRYFVTSASALTLTLPASPALNDEIQIVDASGNASTYNITVARNANKINGGLNNLIIDTNGGWYTLLYTGATYGWKVG